MAVIFSSVYNTASQTITASHTAYSYMIFDCIPYGVYVDIEANRKQFRITFS